VLELTRHLGYHLVFFFEKTGGAEEPLLKFIKVTRTVTRVQTEQEQKKDRGKANREL
jgi:hypothetical protein